MEKSGRGALLRRNVTQDEVGNVPYMYFSIWHQKPMVNGYSDIVPEDFYKIMLPINDFPDAESFKLMQQYKVRYVLWRMPTYNAESRAVLEARFPPFMKYLKPIVAGEELPAEGERVEVVDGAGHAVQSDRPLELVRLTRPPNNAPQQEPR